ncbi:urease accessory protein UreD [Archangium lansingense]|uniref:Urease accessory protein UreD n=1 Tax=Archangium lansingense TaxID=2995310 RepID=A0ABT4ADH4_9BACT|nr:urease accessory protein UreD [Archangium lansinium]MCY1078967.1 urease accessory protein UreD [Archangium lansinium]
MASVSRARQAHVPMIASEHTPTAEVARTSRAGSAKLAFERVGNRTVVTTALAHSPLRLLTPRNHGHAAWVYTSSLGGGLVDGDHLSVELDVAEDSAALLSSQGSTRVYRSPRGCRSELSARVAPGALLAWVPDPTMCFSGARYTQSQDIQLAPSASLVLMEMLTAGRSANGERWAFTHYASSLRVHREGRALIDERWLLDPAHGALPARLGRFDALGTVLLVGPALDSAREALAAQVGSLPVTPRSGLVCSASPLGPDGLVLRVAASSAEALLRTTREWLSFLPSLLGDDPWIRRG